MTLRFWLILPFVLQIAGTVGLVGFFSFRNAQQSVNELSSQLRSELTNRIQQQLQNYIDAPFLINQMNAAAYAKGEIDLTDPEDAYPFWQQVTTFSTTNSIYCGRESDGAFLGVGLEDYANAKQLQIQYSNRSTNFLFHYIRLDASGNPIAFRQGLNRPYDPRIRPWYIAAKTKGQKTWSEIYLDFDAHLPVITASQPVYDQSGKKLLGVCATDFILSAGLDTFLSQLQVGKSGETFIIERSGVLVSSSTATEENLLEGEGENAQRLLASQSKNVLVRETMHHLQQQFGDLQQIQSEQQLSFRHNGRQYVQVVPFKDDRGLDWLIVVVVPEADFMEPIRISGRVTILLCLASVAVATGTGILTARWITKPLLRLHQAAKQIAMGTWDHPIPIDRTDEVGELAQSFNDMAVQLQTSFAQKEALNRELADNRDQLSQILEALPIGVAVLYKDSRQGYINHTGQLLLGTGPCNELPMEYITSMYQLYQAGTDDLYPTEKLPLLQALQGKTAGADDLEVRRFGQVTSLETRAIPVFDANGEVIYAISTFQDISERKWAAQIWQEYHQMLEQEVQERTFALEQEIAERQRAEEALRKREQEFRALAENAPDIIMRVDRHYRYLYMNPTVEKYAGVPASEFIGKTIDSFGTSAELTHLWQTSIQRVVETRQETMIEFESPSIAGTRYYASRIVPEFDEDGLVQSVLAIVRDISDRKQSEIILHQQKEFLNTVINTNPNIIVVKDEEGRFLLANEAAAESLNTTVEEMLGRSDKDYFPLEIAQTFIDQNLYIIESEQPLFVAEEQFLHPHTQQENWFQWQKCPLRMPGSDDIVVLGIGVNITDRKRAEVAMQQAKETAEAASRAKSTFLANMTHELRTPLNAILGFAQILSRDPLTHPNQQQHIQIISQSGEHLLGLINSILDLSKIEAGRMEFLADSFDLFQLVETVTTMLCEQANSKGLQLEVKILPNVPRQVTTDSGKLRQVLINLIGNAIKFTERGGVSLRVAKVNQSRSSRHGPQPLPGKHSTTLLFEVEDTGIGIATADLDRIFEAFEQTHRGKKVADGTGLGLTLSRKFVQLMGGTLTVRSTPGQGSCFSFNLPVEWVNSNPIWIDSLKVYPCDEERSPLDSSTDVFPACPVKLPDLAVALHQASQDWLNQLHQATLSCDDDILLELLDQLPSDQQYLKQELWQMTTQFQFDRILLLLNGHANQQ